MLLELSFDRLNQLLIFSVYLLALHHALVNLVLRLLLDLSETICEHIRERDLTCSFFLFINVQLLLVLDQAYKYFSHIFAVFSDTFSNFTRFASILF